MLLATEAYNDWASGSQFPEDEPSAMVFAEGWKAGWFAGAEVERNKYLAILKENVELYEMCIEQAKTIRKMVEELAKFSGIEVRGRDDEQSS